MDAVLAVTCPRMAFDIDGVARDDAQHRDRAERVQMPRSMVPHARLPPPAHRSGHTPVDRSGSGAGPGALRASFGERPWRQRSERRLGFLPTKVIHLDLARPLHTVSGLEGYVFAFVVVRLAGEPIGTVRVPVHGDRCPATALADAIADRARAIAAAGASPRDAGGTAGVPAAATSVRSAPPSRAATVPARGSTPGTLTVAVCTRIVLRCSGAAWTPSGSCVIPSVSCRRQRAVDRGTARLITERYPDGRLRRRAAPGPGSRPEPRAIAESSSPLLAFTDDDVVADDRWSAAIVRAFEEEPELDALTGLVLPHELATAAQELFERLGGSARASPGGGRRGAVRRHRSGRHVSSVPS